MGKILISIVEKLKKGKNQAVSTKKPEPPIAKEWERHLYSAEEIKAVLEFEKQESKGILPEDKALYDIIFPKSALAADLDKKVDEYIHWYFKNVIKGQCTDVGEYQFPREMRNFIEKMAVWYELRYPDYEIAKRMPYGRVEAKDVSKMMFQDNPYVQTLLDEDSDTRALDWDEFFNAKAFLTSLPYSEKAFFLKPRYKEILYFDPMHHHAHLHVAKNGIVELSENVRELTYGKIRDQELVGKTVKQVVTLFQKRGILLPKENELEQELEVIERYKQSKDGMLDCVMYRIIERGGNRIGPRRAFLFAKEFRRNIDIPMMYAADTSDPNLRGFINEYLKAGGHTDLSCYSNYFGRANKLHPVKEITVAELLAMYHEFTEEEKALHARLVNALASGVNETKLDHEEVMRLRLERKIEKSGQNKSGL